MSRITNIRRFLSSPHPYYYHPGNIYAITSLIFISAFLFLYFFEPFRINFAEHNYPFFVISLLQSLIPILIFLTYFLLLYAVRQKPVEKGWTMGGELMHLSFVLLLMGSGNFFLRPLLYDNPNNWSFQYYMEEVGNAFLVGILLILIFMPLNHFRLRAKNVKLSSQLNTKKSEETNRQDLHCFIQTQLESENFLLSINKLLFARAEGNYVMIFQVNEGAIEKYMKRMTLSQLATQLKSYSQILRTHRAYLINLQQVTYVSGNAQGLQLTLHHYNEQVPVSRSKTSHFRQNFPA